jgi:hypothetical protein
MTQVRIGKCLKVLGFEHSTARVNGRVARSWKRIVEIEEW